jgi:hypothetical protein
VPRAPPRPPPRNVVANTCPGASGPIRWDGPRRIVTRARRCVATATGGGQGVAPVSPTGSSVQAMCSNSTGREGRSDSGSRARRGQRLCHLPIPRKTRRKHRREQQQQQQTNKMLMPLPPRSCPGLLRSSLSTRTSCRTGRGRRAELRGRTPSPATLVPRTPVQAMAVSRVVRSRPTGTRFHQYQRRHLPGHRGLGRQRTRRLRHTTSRKG